MRPEEQIARLRRLHDIEWYSWQQIAEMMQVSRRAVHFWLAGKRMNAKHQDRLRAYSEGSVPGIKRGPTRIVKPIRRDARGV